MQYQLMLEALKSVSKVSKPFEKVNMDTPKLFMVFLARSISLQMGSVW